MSCHNLLSNHLTLNAYLIGIASPLFQLYKRNPDTGETSIALSRDSSCDEDLFSPTLGHETFQLKPIPEKPWPRLVRKGSCKYVGFSHPSWGRTIKRGFVFAPFQFSELAARFLGGFAGKPKLSGAHGPSKLEKNNIAMHPELEQSSQPIPHILTITMWGRAVQLRVVRAPGRQHCGVPDGPAPFNHAQRLSLW